MKHTITDQIDAFEKIHRIKLADYQKEALATMLDSDKPITITMVKDNGKSYYRALAKMVADDICGGNK